MLAWIVRRWLAGYPSRLPDSRIPLAAKSRFEPTGATYVVVSWHTGRPHPAVVRHLAIACFERTYPRFTIAFSAFDFGLLIEPAAAGNCRPEFAVFVHLDPLF